MSASEAGDEPLWEALVSIGRQPRVRIPPAHRSEAYLTLARLPEGNIRVATYDVSVVLQESRRDRERTRRVTP